MPTHRPEDRMDPQIFELINERSDHQDASLDRIEAILVKHIEKDEIYWRKIDVHEGQLNLLKWLFGGTITTILGSFFAWVMTHIKG